MTTMNANIEQSDVGEMNRKVMNEIVLREKEREWAKK